MVGAISAILGQTTRRRHADDMKLKAIDFVKLFQMLEKAQKNLEKMPKNCFIFKF